MGLFDNKKSEVEELVEDTRTMNDEMQLVKFGALVENVEKILGLSCRARERTNDFRGFPESYDTYQHSLSLSLIFGNITQSNLAYQIMRTHSGLIYNSDYFDHILFRIRGGGCQQPHRQPLSLDEKIHLSQKLMMYTKESKNKGNKYIFVFWSLMILAVDKNQGEDKLSLVCDFAKLVEITDDEMEDLVLIVKLVLKQDISGLSLKTETIKNRFEHVIAKYEG